MEAGEAPFSEWLDNWFGESNDCMKDMPGKIEITWGWVESGNNGTGVESRMNSSPSVQIKGIAWENGPSYLQHPEEEWPIKNKNQTTNRGAQETIQA